MSDYEVWRLLLILLVGLGLGRVLLVVVLELWLACRWVALAVWPKILR